VVRYESSRGLEGWTVVCLDIDAFYARQLATRGDRVADMFERPEEAARRQAVRWCLIPLTRAIDTLVLQVTPGTELDTILCELASTNADFVERCDVT
jgi:hypothetical protein